MDMLAFLRPVQFGQTVDVVAQVTAGGGDGGSDGALWGMGTSLEAEDLFQALGGEQAVTPVVELVKAGCLDACFDGGGQWAEATGELAGEHDALAAFFTEKDAFLSALQEAALHAFLASFLDPALCKQAHLWVLLAVELFVDAPFVGVESERAFDEVQPILPQVRGFLQGEQAARCLAVDLYVGRAVSWVEHADWGWPGDDVGAAGKVGSQQGPSTWQARPD